MRILSVFEAFMINTLKPEGPYLMLMLEGEQGSGKSLFQSNYKNVGWSQPRRKLRMPGTERDLMIIAKDAHLMVFDNVSGMKADMSDAFCSLLRRWIWSPQIIYRWRTSNFLRNAPGVNEWNFRYCVPARSSNDPCLFASPPWLKNNVKRKRS